METDWVAGCGFGVSTITTRYDNSRNWLTKVNQSSEFLNRLRGFLIFADITVQSKRFIGLRLISAYSDLLESEWGVNKSWAVEWMSRSTPGTTQSTTGHYCV